MAKKTFLSFFLSFILSLQPLFASIPSLGKNQSFSTENFKNGTISGGSYCGGSELVVWIQDLHSNAQAQKSIVGLVDEIAAKTNLTALYGEGFVCGKADVSVLESIPDEENKEKSIQYLYDRGFLSAAEYIALRGDIEVLGVEDKLIYGTNLKLLEDITKNKNINEKNIKALADTLARLESAYLSKGAAKFKAAIRNNFYKYVKEEDSLSFYPNLRVYTASAQESLTVSPEKINRELSFCLEDLKREMPYRQYSDLINGLNSGQESVFAGLYGIMLRQHPALLKKYPRLEAFLKKQNSLFLINRVELVNEETAFAGDMARSKAETNLDAELFDLGEALNLLSAFFDASISRGGYVKLKANKDYYGYLFNKYFEDTERKFANSLLNDKKRTRFYENNLLRDKLFLKELLKDIPSADISRKGAPDKVFENLSSYRECRIIIAGGFHYGIAEELDKAGVSYLIITPSVKGAGEAKKYDDFILYGAQTLNKVFHADFDYGSAGKVLNGFFSVISTWGGSGVPAEILQDAVDDWIKTCPKIEGLKVNISDIPGGYALRAQYRENVLEKEVKAGQDETPPALGKRIDKLAAMLLDSAQASIPVRMIYKAIITFGFTGVYGEFLKDPDSFDKQQKSFIKKIRNIASTKLGKNTEIKISSNPDLIANSTDWALATLTLENGNFTLYLHEVLLGNYLFENLPEGYSDSKFFSELVRHEKLEYDALNNPDSQTAAEFEEYLSENGEILNSGNFHKFLAATGRSLNVLNIASQIVKNVLANRAKKNRVEMFDHSVEDARKAFLAQNSEEDFYVPEEKQPEVFESPFAAARKHRDFFEPEDLTPVENEAGILVVSKAAAYFRAVDSLITFLSGQIDVNETIDVMTDTYDASWVKLAVLRKLSQGKKIIAANIHTPGTLIWTDALMEDSSGKRTFLHTNHIFFHEASEESKAEEGLRRFGSGSIVKAVSLIAQARQLIVSKGQTQLKELDEALVVLLDENITTAKKKSLALKQLRKYAKNINLDTANGVVSLIADASQELRRDYFEYMIEFVNSPEGKRQYGKVDNYVFVIDTRGVPAIKEKITQRKKEIELEYGDKYQVLFADEIVDANKSIGEKLEELNGWSYEYADDFEEDAIDGNAGSHGRILYGTVYSRYVGLLLELVTLAELTENHGYKILQSGHEIKDEEGRYITELDVVAEDNEGVVSIIECKSARSKMPYNDILKSKVIYKLDTYLKYQDIINADLGEGKEFRQVIFVMDTGGKKSLEQRLKGEEEKLSALYGFPVKFVFIESNPQSVKNIISKTAEPKTLSLLAPLMRTRTQTLVSAMLAPLWEVLLWIPAIGFFGGSFITVSVAVISAITVFALLHNVVEWLTAKRDGKRAGFDKNVKSFFSYLRHSAALGAGTTAAYFAAFLFTGSHALASFAAVSANIIVHYIIQQYSLSATSLKHDAVYFDSLKDKYTQKHELNMVEALKEAEHGRGKHSEFSTFLKPAVGAFITDEKGNKGRGYNGEGSLLHAEYFSIINYLQNCIERNEIGETGEYTEKGRKLSALLKAVLLNAETLNRRVFEKNPRLLKMSGYEVIYPKTRTIDDVFNETNLVFKYVNGELGNLLADASLYCTLAPCNKCSKMMAFLGIKELIFASSAINSSHKGAEVLEDAGVKVTGEVLTREAGEYIANYSVTNSSPGRTRIASFFQTLSRVVAGFLDVTTKKQFVNFNDIYKSPVNIARVSYEKAAGKPDEAVIRIADAGNYHEILNSSAYATEGVKPVIFADYGFEYDHSGTVNFSPVFTALSDKGSVFFTVYFNGTKSSPVFYVKVIKSEGLTADEAYQLAYVHLLNELKAGVLNPSINDNVKNILGTGAVDIIGVEVDFSHASDVLYARVSDLYNLSAADAIPENITEYRFFAQMKEDIAQSRAEGRETETVENRALLTGKSVSVNIASLGSAGQPGKITDIAKFASAVKESFKTINISAYMPLKKGEWADDFFIDWAQEAEKTGNPDIALRIRGFYSMNLNREFNLTFMEEILAFEKEAASELLARAKNKLLTDITPFELQEYYADVKERQLTQAIADVKKLNLEISSYYVYDVSVPEKENIRNINKILKLFDGAILETAFEYIEKTAETVYEYTEGKAVAFKTEETVQEDISSKEAELKNKYGFGIIKEFDVSEDSYGKTVNIPVEKVSDTVLDKLENSASVIVSVPETSENIVENISATKNGESIISKLKNTAKKLTLKSEDKIFQDYYLYGIDIVSKIESNEFFTGNVSVNNVGGRGLLAVMKALEKEDAGEVEMKEIFRVLNEIVNASGSVHARKIAVITSRLEKQYFSSGDVQEKKMHAQSLKNFIYGIYYRSEIMRLPVMKKYEGSYASRAGDYASDARKDIINTQNGMRVDDSTGRALKTLYMLLSADMLEKGELLSLLDYYAGEIKADNDVFMFAAIFGLAAKKYGKKEFLKYSQRVKERIKSYRTEESGKWLYISALASVSFVENDVSADSLIKKEIGEKLVFHDYKPEQMIMAISLFELLNYDREALVFDVDNAAVTGKITNNYGIAGLYAKLFKMTSLKMNVSGLEKELQILFENLSITSVKRYSKSADKVKSASIAMALTELCELAGTKNDFKNMQDSFKQPSAIAMKSILSAA